MTGWRGHCMYRCMSVLMHVHVDRWMRDGWMDDRWTDG